MLLNIGMVILVVGIVIVIEIVKRKKEAKKWKDFGSYAMLVIETEEKKRRIQNEKAERRAKARKKRGI